MNTLKVIVYPRKALLYLAFLIIILGLSEAVLRNDRLTERLEAASFGSEHQQFEIQLTRLAEHYRTYGSVDCIFVGDSLVWLDIDPIAFRTGFQDSSENEILCFNFGIAALPASGVNALTRILVNDYNPHLIVYGLHANAVVISQVDPDAKIVLETPWVQHKTGQLNPIGWLYQNSYFARYQEVLRRLLLLESEAVINERGITTHQRLGFDPKEGQRVDINSAPSWDSEADRGGFEKYYQYHIYPENLAGIQDLTHLADHDTEIVLVMMPVHESFYAFFQNGEMDYKIITNAIQESVKDTDIVLIKPNIDLKFINSDWWDYSHLNKQGAAKFSYWLGNEVGRQVTLVSK